MKHKSIVERAIYTGFRKDDILDMRIESICIHDLTPTGEVELIVIQSDYTLSAIILQVLLPPFQDLLTNLNIITGQTFGGKVISM